MGKTWEREGKGGQADAQRYGRIGERRKRSIGVRKEKGLGKEGIRKEGISQEGISKEMKEEIRKVRKEGIRENEKMN